jgi:hypothetical protein
VSHELQSPPISNILESSLRSLGEASKSESEGKPAKGTCIAVGSGVVICASDPEVLTGCAETVFLQPGMEVMCEIR